MLATKNIHIDGDTPSRSCHGADGRLAVGKTAAPRVGDDRSGASGDSGAGPEACTQRRPRNPSLVRRTAPRLIIPLLVLCVFAVFFVGWDVLERHYFPNISTAWRHGLLTLRAGIVTALASVAVYSVMRRQERRLSTTAGKLSRLLESYGANTPQPARFENPHLTHCRDVLDCQRVNCPMYHAAGTRCWQVMALSRKDGGDDGPRIDLQQCHDCRVYRLSCPDRLTELGESFNNLMFLLDEEAAQVGRMRAMMLEKEKMVAIGQMATGIAHEVGNPLSSISSVVQILKRGGLGAAEGEQLDLIETHIQRISTIVRQLVSLARPGAQRWDQVDINKIIEEALRLVRYDRRSSSVEIDCDFTAPLPLTFALQDQLQQVFINLALNALDAMPDGGKLTLRAEPATQDILVTVEDSGCGIPPEAGRRIFEPFFTTKEPGQGTGLGLSVSYGIIQKHGGTIGFESTVGLGARFAVRIPILDKPPEA